MVNNILNSVGKILGCGIPIFWSGVISFGYPGVMCNYWQEKFNVGNAETGLIVTFMLLALAMSMFISGSVHARYGMAKCVLISTSFYIIAFTILHFAKNIYWVYVWAFIENLGLSFAYGPGVTTVQRAFSHNKGIVSGIINLLFGIAAAILSPILNALFNKEGYTFVNITTVIAIVISNLFAYVLVIVSYREKNQDHQQASSPNDMTVKQALKTKEFWIIWFAWVFMGGSGVAMVTLSKSYTIAIGKTGVVVLTAYNLANGIFRIFIGWFTDKIGASVMGAISFFIAAVGYLIMPHSSNLIIVSLGALGVGIGFGGLFTVSGPLVADIFGLTSFGMIYGITFIAYGLVGGIVGPGVSGFLLEHTDNNYIIVFTYLGVMSLIGAILMICVNEKKIMKERERLAKEEIEMKEINESITVEIDCDPKEPKTTTVA